MVKFVVLASASLALLTSFSAMADSATINDIIGFSRSIRQVAPTTTASDADQSRARQLLSDALDLLDPAGRSGGGGPGVNRTACIQVAYTAYFHNLSGVDATNRAVALCKSVWDLDVLNYLYPLYFHQFTETQAMDKAGAGAGAASVGKLDIIQVAYAAYFHQQTEAGAASKAVAGVVKVPAGSLACVNQLYSGYLQNLNESGAMDKALAGCGN